ncbi:hypothetical protein VSDG_05082 [Cytospora chrysosperma]|uniref:Uncharacterized protein n=1 Tax=Cytospora chrysosperma TaxID=252740 RepID=A0A423VYN6_CYTCH|nr:hypothetical protein VSDG_05082 [Valsa sordida]
MASQQASSTQAQQGSTIRQVNTINKTTMLDDAKSSGASPRQQTFSPIRQGEESPRARTVSCLRDIYVPDAHLRGPSHLGPSRIQTIQELLRSADVVQGSLKRIE